MPRSISVFPILVLLAAASAGVVGCSDDETPTGVDDKTPPGSVTTLAVSVEQNHIVLTWLAPGDDGGSGRAAAYDVRYSSGTINPSNWDSATQVDGEPAPKPAGGAERFVMPNLTPDASYYFCLKTRDSAGNVSALSNVVLLDVDPPAAITDLDVVRLAPRSLRLRWTAPSDNNFSGRAIAYDLRTSAQSINEQNWEAADPVPGAPDPIAPGGTQEMLISELEPGTHLFFAIRSIDLAGNISPLSNVRDAVTPESGWTGFGMDGTNDAVYSFYARDTDLVVGGLFTQAGSTPASRIAAWNGQNWSAYGAGVRGSPATNMVTALIEYGGDVIVGGQFDEAGDITIRNLARWDGTAWQHLLGGADAFVTSMAIYDGKLFVGGAFYQIGGIPSHAIAYWNGLTWSSMAWGEYPDVFGVSDFALHDGALIACGIFTRAGLTPANRIAGWDGNVWSALGDGFSDGDPITTVSSVVEFGGDLIAGGNFQMSGSTPIDRLARWDGMSWSEFGGGMGAPDETFVSDMVEYNGDLIVAGRFTTIGGQAVSHIARWNGSTWDAMDDGVSGGGTFMNVRALAIHDGSLFVGGEFQYAGGIASPNIARWDE